MNYSNEVRAESRKLIFHYARLNPLDDQYTIDIDEIADFDLNNFAALILSEDKYLSSEATGPDNSYYESKMFPALIKFLKNTTDKDEEIDFSRTWKECTTNYCKTVMIDLLERALHEKNFDESYSRKDPSLDNSLWR